MRIISFVSVLVCVIALATPQVSSASSVIRSGETVSITDDQTIEADFYSAASKIHISGEIGEDLVATGGQVTINGSVAEDAFLIAGRVDIHGTIGDDLRIVAGEVTIAGPVMGDVLVIGGSVHILSTASISGDLILYGGDVVIDGSVGGDVLGSVGSLRIDSAVAGTVDITVGQFVLGDRASVSGDVRYISNELIVQAPGAVVSGTLLRNDPIIPTMDSNIHLTLIPILILLFSVLVWHLISRHTLRPIVSKTLTKSFKPLAYGLLTLVFMPFVIVILFASMLGTLLSGVFLFGYMLLVLLSIIALPAVLGQLLSLAFGQSTPHPTLLTIIVGVTGVALLLLLPIVGPAVLFGLMVIIIGAMVDIILHPKRDTVKS